MGMISRGLAFAVWIFLILSLLINTASAEINVTLNEPQDNYVFNSTNNITFNCSASTDKYLESVDLYNDINGSFVLNHSKDLGQIAPNSATSLLFHFNNDSSASENDMHVYDWSGKGNNGTVHGGKFNSTGGKFYGAFEFNGSNNYIEMNDSNSLDLVSEGSIEFWMKYYNINTWTAVITKDESCGNTFPYSIYLSPLDIQKRTRVRLALDDWNIDFFSTTYLYNKTWYHVVATWNDSEARIYINGSLDETNTDSKSMYADSSKVRIGITRPGCGWGEGPGSFNGTIDELALYNVMLSPEEVSEHFNRGLTNKTDVNFTAENAPDGTYKWNCLVYDNDSQSNWSSSNYTFSIDLQTPPSVDSITFSPNSSDDVDPDVTINVIANITDISGVDSAVFQYKRSGISTWNNVTMNNISSEEWNASFFTSSPPDTWDYRIWSSDMLGHSGYGQQYNISATYEYSWAVSPENLGEKYILYNKNGSLGIVVINNTGDYPLNFKISSDFPKTYFNISNPNDFDIDAKDVKYINVNATAPSEPGEYQIEITVNATTENADPSEIIVNGTVISYWGGPYLTASIAEYESIVQQSTGGMNYTAKVRNIGNETATDVWINWTLPSGWSNTSGNLAHFAGNLINGSAAFNNITVSISSSAKAGVSYLYVKTDSSNNSTANTSLQVSVICSDSDGVCGAGCSYVTDDDCSPPSGITGSISAYPVSEKNYDIELVIPSRLDISRGETKKTEIGIKNPLKDTELNNVYLSLSGYPQTFISVTPAYLTGIGYGETKYFQAEIKAPVYAVYEEHDLNITAKGEFIDAGETVNAEKSLKILLVTHKFLGNETLDYFEKARESLEEMNDSGLEISGIWEIFNEIEKAMGEGNYDRVKELSEEITGIKDLAFKLNGQILEMERGIEGVREYNFNLPETEKMLSLVKSAFQRGDYGRAEERMSNALLMYSMEIASASFWILVYNYWWLVLAGLFVSGAGIVMMRRKVIIKSVKKGLDSLIEEEKIIINLIIKLQEEHFLERKTGAEEYQNLMESYEKHIEDISESRISLISRLIGMLKSSKALEKLREEEGRVGKRIKELQKDYFELGNIGRRYYDNLVGSLKNELTEIQKMIYMMEGGRDV